MSDQNKKLATAIAGLILIVALAFAFLSGKRTPPADPAAVAAQKEAARLETLIEQDRAAAAAAAEANEMIRQAELNEMENILANTADPAPDLPLEIDLPLPTPTTPSTEEPAVAGPPAPPPIPKGGDSNVFSPDIYLKRKPPKQ